MKKAKIVKKISIICSIIGLISSILGLIVGITSIVNPDLGRIGTLLIYPSIILFLTNLIDLLITVEKIKKGLIYSFISSLIKIEYIIHLIIIALNEKKYGFQSPKFITIIFTCLIAAIITIPSTFNTIKLFNKRKKYKN